MGTAHSRFHGGVSAKPIDAKGERRIGEADSREGACPLPKKDQRLIFVAVVANRNRRLYLRFLLIILARILAIFDDPERLFDLFCQLRTAFAFGAFNRDPNRAVGIDRKLNFLFYCHFFTVKVITLSCFVSSISKV